MACSGDERQREEQDKCGEVRGKKDKKKREQRGAAKVAWIQGRNGWGKKDAG